MPKVTTDRRKIQMSIDRLSLVNAYYSEVIRSNELIIESRKKQLEDLRGSYKYTLIGFKCK